MTLLFWTLFVVLAFAIALAAQMRIMVSIVLRRALAAHFGGQPGDADYQLAIRPARPGQAVSEARSHLETHYPRPLAHLALARKVSFGAPLVLLVLVIAGRLSSGSN